ncbi:DnaJ domain-containing protein [Luteimonas sp. M1R5S18]|jgi:DnaJ-class molecular chaperone|uniref:DnaJ domain-containing protein n=1 Tax=Luteimonas rhizosphaericola TaxID=3042024 RepID=A0ABT6JMN2_9GAMM|nr:DnaJ domain-containing protein [Luteimonas rhizosphaericola]MDH5831792.1 DnaJ domain-containing protein [Luteimonas rhizosphaericola]
MNRWYGKLLGFIAGWLLLRHPAGGLIGLIIGHAFDAGWIAPGRAAPYRVLGLTGDASDAEVDQAYRRLMAQYHPDKVAGAAPELRAQAEKKARAINAAYDRIRRRRDGRRGS